jgi:hypothetical protein
MLSREENVLIRLDIGRSRRLSKKRWVTVFWLPKTLALTLHLKADEPADLCVVTKYFGLDERSNGYLRDATSMMYLGGVDTVSTVFHPCIYNQRIPM